ncbi:MAG: hypothetical protein ACI901_002026, partial [Octadecabacter sp.]
NADAVIYLLDFIFRSFSTQTTHNISKADI